MYAESRWNGYIYIYICDVLIPGTTRVRREGEGDADGEDKSL